MGCCGFLSQAPVVAALLMLQFSLPCSRKDGVGIGPASPEKPIFVFLGCAVWGVQDRKWGHHLKWSLGAEVSETIIVLLCCLPLPLMHWLCCFPYFAMEGLIFLFIVNFFPPWRASFVFLNRLLVFHCPFVCSMGFSQAL